MSFLVHILRFSFLSVLLLVGCASSSDQKEKKESFPNLVTLQKPTGSPHRTSKVYIDSVEQITCQKEPALLIYGTFPDGCTKLESVTHHTSGDSLSLHLTAWRNPELICTQALSPFSYIYRKLNKKELNRHSKIYVNRTAYSY